MFLLVIFVFFVFVQCECPDSCLRDMIGDGICDDACYHPDCNYDGGDCDAGCTPRRKGDEWIRGDEEISEILQRIYVKNHTVTIIDGEYIPDFDFKKKKYHHKGTSYDPTKPGLHYTWDYLKEVIIGNFNESLPPAYEPAVLAVYGFQDHVVEKLMNDQQKSIRVTNPDLFKGFHTDLDGYVAALEKEGIKIHRPPLVDLTKPAGNEYWKTDSRMDQIFPRDILLVIGNHFFPAKMSWRCRYGELEVIDGILKKMEKQGGIVHWYEKPVLRNSLYNLGAVVDNFRKFLDKEKWPSKDCKFKTFDDFPYFFPVTSNNEPLFDSPDFAPIGYDVFCQLSHVTNLAGIKYISRELGKEYRFHLLPTHRASPEDHGIMHIDTTIIPIGPKLVVVCDKELKIEHLPSFFDDWEKIVAPRPERKMKRKSNFDDDYLGLNGLQIGPKTIILNPTEKIFSKILHKHGYKTIHVPLLHLSFLGGGHHCSSNDIWRSPTPIKKD